MHWCKDLNIKLSLKFDPMLTFWLLCMHMKDGHVQGQDKVSRRELNGFGKIKNSTMNKNHKLLLMEQGMIQS